MAPAALDGGVFSGAGKDARLLARQGREYLLATSSRTEGITAHLPAGKWAITLFDAVAMKRTPLAGAASGRFTFDTPALRAVMVHFRKMDE